MPFENDVFDEYIFYIYNKSTKNNFFLTQNYWKFNFNVSSCFKKEITFCFIITKIKGCSSIKRICFGFVYNRNPSLGNPHLISSLPIKFLIKCSGTTYLCSTKTKRQMRKWLWSHCSTRNTVNSRQIPLYPLPRHTKRK